MGEIGGTEVRSVSYGVDSVEMGVQTYRFNEELRLMMDGAVAPPVSGSSFKALLGLPENQAMELLHSSGIDNSAAAAGDIHGGAATDVVRCHGVAHENIPYIHHQLNCSPAFPSNAGLIERAAKYSFFATAAGGGGCGGCGGGAGQDDSPESSSAPSNSEAKPIKVKNEPADDGANPNSLLQTSDLEPAGKSEKQMKRKEREKKEKGSSKKSRKENSGDGEKLPYVHVRARRGQATDSHSLAERARREKINARMKLLQELVPGCNKFPNFSIAAQLFIHLSQPLPPSSSSAIINTRRHTQPWPPDGDDDNTTAATSDAPPAMHLTTADPPTVDAPTDQRQIPHQQPTPLPIADNPAIIVCPSSAIIISTNLQFESEGDEMAKVNLHPTTMELKEVAASAPPLAFDGVDDEGWAASSAGTWLVVDGHVVVVVLGGWSTMVDEDGCIVDGCLLMVAWVIEGVNEIRV
ncbi:hypothetical protein Dimus_029678 [Dionaea muscipula]